MLDRKIIEELTALGVRYSIHSMYEESPTEELEFEGRIVQIFQGTTVCKSTEPSVTLWERLSLSGAIEKLVEKFKKFEQGGNSLEIERYMYSFLEGWEIRYRLTNTNLYMDVFSGGRPKEPPEPLLADVFNGVVPASILFDFLEDER